MSGFFTARFFLHQGASIQQMERDFFLPDMASVRREIVNLGGVPLTIKERKLQWYQREFISRKYKVGFLRSLAFHVSAGMSPGKALSLVIESERSSRKRFELEPALEILKRGGGFTTALKELHMFDRGTIAILSAGEYTGSLKDVISSAVSHMEEKGKAWKMFTAALGWLWFDIGTAFSSVFGVQFFALPWLEQNGVSAASPEAIAKFKHALATSYIINSVLLIIALIAVVGGAIIAVSYLMNKHKADHFAGRVVSKIPLIKNFIENSGIAETFGIVGRMLEGKVKFSEAVKVAENATPAAPIRKFWQTTLQRIEHGDTIDKAMRSTILTRSESLQISAHQNSDQLSRLFLNIGEDRTASAKRNLQTIIVGGIAATILYTFLAAASALWVVWVQNSGVNASIEAITSSGDQK